MSPGLASDLAILPSSSDRKPNPDFCLANMRRLRLNTHARTTPQSGLPPLRKDTVFEVIAGGESHYIKVSALQRGILRERHKRKGPAGFLFSQRPTLE
jgi:hypothetical protein